MKTRPRFWQLLLGVIFLLGTLSANAGRYMQVGFTSAEAVPTVAWSSGHATLSFTDNELTELFAGYTISQFEKEYPAADGLGGGDILLKRVYKIRLANDSLLPELYDNLRRGYDAIDDFFLMDDPIPVYDPTDYWKCATFPDPCQEKMLDLINAKGAWELTRGLPCIKIGITDTWFVNHTDLDTKVDNLSSLTSSLILPATSSWGTGIGPHGTEVAALAGAITNNGQGIASLGHDIRLAYYLYTINNILKAAQEGCKVVNCSWITGYSSYDQLIIDSVYRKGVTIVAAAGNGSPNNTYFHYPASYAHVISVSAVGSQNAVGDYVHFRNWVDCHRWSFDSVNYPSEYNQTYQHNDSVDICAPAYWLLTLGYNNSHTSNMGTSLASPQVAAAAALLLSLNPNFTPDQVEYYLKAGADDISGVWDNYLWNGKLGAGRLNAGASLALAKDSACVQALTDIVWRSGSVTGTIINNWEAWLHNTVYFSAGTVLTGKTVYWEFVFSNSLGNKQTIYKTGNNVSLQLYPTPPISGSPGVDSEIDVYDPNSGQLTSQQQYLTGINCNNTLEVYVRQGNTDSCCVSAFYKETANNPSIECEEGRPGKNSLIVTGNLDFKKSTILIYPSPATEGINIRMNKASKSFNKETFEIISLEGKVLKRGFLTGEITYVDLKNIYPGIYIIKAGASITKFLKQ